MMSDNKKNLELQETVEELQNRVDRMSRELRSRMGQSVETTKQAVRDYPAIALGVSFAAGIMVGLMLGFKGRDAGRRVRVSDLSEMRVTSNCCGRHEWQPRELPGQEVGHVTGGSIAPRMRFQARRGARR